MLLAFSELGPGLQYCTVQLHKINDSSVQMPVLSVLGTAALDQWFSTGGDFVPSLLVIVFSV